MKPTGNIEHRIETRFRHLVPVHVGNLELTTANVSLHGMQLVCPLRPFNRIKPEVERGQFIVKVALAQGEPIEAALAVRYVSPHRDEMLIGVRMTVTDVAAQARWASYIGELSKGIRLSSGKT
jgi:hypothetical protein